MSGCALRSPKGAGWGPSPAELAAVRGRLEAFADDVFESLPRKDQRARGQCYLRGLMLKGWRKSVEPMAQRLGEVHYQALHHLVAVSPWDWRSVRRRLAERLVGVWRRRPGRWTTPAFPRTAATRWGAAPVPRHAGQDRQLPTGGLGQHRHRAGQLPLDWRLFLPESWDGDVERTTVDRDDETLRVGMQALFTGP